MIWQDYAILGAQGVMLLALMPTLRDRSAWPRVSTCLLTGSALAGMAATFVTLQLWLATAVTVGSALVWLRMAAGYRAGNFIPRTRDMSNCGPPPKPRR